jgi:uncharacterized protein with von Willebrand factor type A (vWA) domain
MLEISKQQKRSFYLLHFSAENKERIKTFDFPKGEPYDINKMIEACEYFSGGGTLYEPVLELSQDIIEEDGDYQKADILFITDGECPLDSQWLAKFLNWKKQKKVSIYTVLVDVTYNSDFTVNKFSEQVHKLQTLRDASENGMANLAFDLFSTI